MHSNESLVKENTEKSDRKITLPAPLKLALSGCRNDRKHRRRTQ